MYVYLKSEPELWTVGHYSPFGEWMPESDHDSKEAAAERTSWLNGNNTTIPFRGNWDEAIILDS